MYLWLKLSIVRGRRCFRWGTLGFHQGSSIAGQNFEGHLLQERLNVQNNAVPRQRTAPWTRVPQNANDPIAHTDLLTYFGKYLQVLHYSCHTANGAGLRSWLAPRCCMHHIVMSVGLIPRTAATFGPLDVLFTGSLGLVRTTVWSRVQKTKNTLKKKQKPDNKRSWE